MNESNAKHCDVKGPCRETAFAILERRVAALKREAAGLEGLLGAVRQMDVGSAAEEALWEILVASRARVH